ncbi:hypothetical protein NKJ46_30610 [Mesorhizobium sp. M0166]|uniref:hypothetical protein n=1 Tax=unclassified Mesorhizobium TaxID=325217 RepID=UPI003337F8A5
MRPYASSSGRGADWTSKYTGLVEAARELEVRNAIFEGEAVVTNDAGLPDFDALQKAVHSDPSAMILGAFDIMHLDGYDPGGYRGDRFQARSGPTSNWLKTRSFIFKFCLASNESPARPHSPCWRSPTPEKYVGSAFISLGRDMNERGNGQRTMPARLRRASRSDRRPSGLSLA